MPDRQGVGIFARPGFADEDTNPIEWSVSCGIGGNGVIPGRDHESFGVGYYYSAIEDTRLGGVLGVSDHTQGAEVFYNITVTPTVHLTFDAQVADAPFPNVDSAVILRMGLQVNS